MTQMPRNNVVAVDLGGTKLAVALVGPGGKLFERSGIRVDTSSSVAPVKQIVELTRPLLNGTPGKGKAAAVGVAVPGLVRRDGTVWAPNLTGWRRMPLAKRLARALGVPIVVESDRNASVLGETWRGAAKGKNDAIVFMLGTGIAAGIWSGGRLVRGAHELSGCAGWMVVTDAYGTRAKQVGQLESLAAGPAIALVATQERSRKATNGSAYEVAQAARCGDPLAIKAYLEAGRLLGYGAANLVSLFDPEIIVLTGGLAQASDLFLDALRRAMKERAQPISGKRVRVVKSKLGADANLLGVARLAGVAYAHWPTPPKSNA
jgi:glucokinase